MDRRSRPGSGSTHRDQLDTIPADSEVLGRLKTLSRIDADVDSLLANPVVEVAEPGPRMPLVSVPFDLTRPAAVALTEVRPAQVSIPFELSRESPIALRPRPAEFDPPSDSTPLPVKSRLGWWLGFIVVLAAVIAGLGATGVARQALQSILGRGG